VTQLIGCEGISKRFGALPLFSGLSLNVHSGERVGVLGPNGAGKSTFLKIMAGLEDPDSGTVSRRTNTRICWVAQESVFDPKITVWDALAHALAKVGIDASDKSAEILATLSQIGLDDPDRTAGSLSGGWKKRLSIAQALVLGPDVLLMDEPTNHLDLEGIEWLEQLCLSARFASIIISHDRWFLEAVATRMVEINKVFPGGMFAALGTYADFLQKKADFLEAQSKTEQTMANKMRREEAWLRRGAKARTTKSSARIREAGELKEQLNQMRERSQSARMSIEFSTSERKTRRLIAAENLTAGFGSLKLFEGVSFSLGPGTRLGISGLNGSGKSTLLRILTGEIQQVAGIVHRADQLRLVYFDQQRAHLDLSLTLKRTLAPDADSVVWNNKAVHVASWASKFGFRTEQLDVQVSRLSGGERARALMARLMLQPADVLILDEPTNDLDLPTLEIVEESLMEFPGAVVLVTHDRAMLDRVSTVILALAPEGQHEFLTGWEQVEQFNRLRETDKIRSTKNDRDQKRAASTPGKKLTYKDQREYDGMEQTVLKAEEELAALEAAANDPKIATQPHKLTEAVQAAEKARVKLDHLYARWAELEAKTQTE
jgi:ATP-binding cassette subfamily F protein uup